ISLNGHATAAAAQALIRNVTYHNSNGGGINTADRTVRITINDGDGGTSANADVTVTVVGVNDAPTATNLTQSKTLTEGGSAVALDDIVVTDVDSGETVTATLALSIPAAGTLST